MFHLLQVCLYRNMLKKTARIWFISDLFPHMNEAWNRSENIGIHVIFSCLHSRGPYPICATREEKKSELGHLNHAV